jgi:hypothetical protein
MTETREATAAPTPAEREKRLGIMEKALGVTTALLVLVTTVFGFLAKKATDDKQDLDADVSRQQQRVTQLEKENDALRARPPAATGAVALPSGVLRTSTAPIVLRKGESIDFDSSAADWGVTTNGYDTDLKLNPLPAGFYSFPGLSLIDAVPTYAACTADAVQYQSLATPEQVTAGARFCVKTGRHRVAGVVVEQAQNNLVAVSITVTVWG